MISSSCSTGFHPLEEVQRARGIAVQGDGLVVRTVVTRARLVVRVAMADALGDDRSEEMLVIPRIDLASRRG